MKKILVLVLTVLLVFGATAMAFAADVHSVVAQRPLYLTDGITGTAYSNLSGTCSITTLPCPVSTTSATSRSRC